MKLLKLQEREVLHKKEKDRSRIQASELSDEVSRLIKSFNRTRTDLANKEKLLLEDYGKFREEVDEKRYKLEEDIKELTHKRDTALEPLYSKERTIEKKIELLDSREEEVGGREKDIRIREHQALELEKTCNGALEIINKKEKELSELDKHLTLRANKLKKHVKGQKELLRQNKERLRQWLKKERAK